MAVATLAVRFIAHTAELEKGFANVERSIAQTGKNMSALGSRMSLGLTLPLLGIGAAAVKMATDMNASMANVATLIPGNVTRVNALKTAVQEMAIATGKSTGDLADGLYQVVSAFGDSADSAKLLQVAAKASVAGLAFTTDAINLISAVTKGYGDTSVEAAQKASDLAFMTVKLGQTTFPELAKSMGSVVPIAAKLRVSQEELFAGFSTLTGVTGNTSEVSTQFAAVLRAMLKPTTDMSSAVKALGFSGSEALVSSLGLVGSLQKLIGTTNGSAESVGKLFGRAEALNAVFALTGSQAGTFVTKLDEIKKSAGATDAAFREQTEGVNAAGFAWKQFKEKIAVAGQNLGDVLIPHLLRAADAMKPIFDGTLRLVSGFGKLPQPIQTATIAVAGLAAAAGPVIFVFGQLLIAASAVSTSLGLAGAAAVKSGQSFTGLLGTLGRFAGPLALLGAGLLAAKVAFDAFSRSTEEGLLVIGGIVPAVGLVTVAVDKLGDSFPRLRGVFDDVVSIVKNSMILAFRQLGDALDMVVEAMSRTVDIVARSFQPVLDALGVGGERFARVMTTVVIPAIKGVAAQFIISLPPIQNLLLLLSALPGFGEIEGALDRVAKRMQALVDEADKSKAAIASMGVIFKGGMDSADKWGETLDSARRNVLSASTAILSFGGSVQGIIPPLDNSGDKLSDFAKKLKALKEQFSGKELVQSAKAWAQALKAPGAELQVLANQSLRQDMLQALDAVEEHFGSLEKAGVGALAKIAGQARAVELAMEPLANIPVSFIPISTNIPQIPRSSLMSGILDPIARNPLDLSSINAEHAIAQVRAGLQKAIDASDPLNFWQKMLGDTKALGFAIGDSVLRAIQGGGSVIVAAAGTLGQFFTTKLATYLTAAKDVGGKAIGGFLGGAISAVLPAVGSLLGPLVSKITDVFSGLFGSKGRDLVKDFAASFGGFDALQKKLQELGNEGGRLWINLTQGVGRNNLDQARAAIEAVNAALGTQSSRLANATAVMAEYGFAFEDAGQKFRNMRLGDELSALYEKTLTLRDVGIDYDEILRRQADQYNTLLRQALNTNTEIDHSMRPLLQRLVDMGLLVDANGNALTDLGNVTWATTLTQGFRDVTDAIYSLRDALVGGVGGALDDLSRRKVNIPIGFDIDNIGPLSRGQLVPQLASGGIVRRPTLALVGEAGPEAVIPLEQLGRSGRGGTGLNAEPRSIGPFTILIPPGELTRAMKDGTPIVVQAINDNHQGAHTQLFGRGAPLGVI